MHVGDSTFSSWPVDSTAQSSHRCEATILSNLICNEHILPGGVEAKLRGVFPDEGTSSTSVIVPFSASIETRRWYCVRIRA